MLNFASGNESIYSLWSACYMGTQQYFGFDLLAKFELIFWMGIYKNVFINQSNPFVDIYNLFCTCILRICNLTESNQLLSAWENSQT